MNKKELWEKVDFEIQGLKYYSMSKSRENLDMSKEYIYEQLKRMDYVKEIIPLDLRCMGYLTYLWKDDMIVENLIPLNERRNPNTNKFSPLEIYLKLYPEERETIYKMLNKLI